MSFFKLPQSCQPHTFKNQRGFTLLEVLLALAIMAMLTLSGYLVLDGVLRAESAQRQQLAQLRSLQRAVMIMDKDFQQMIARNTRDTRLKYPVFSLSPSWLQSDDGRVSFIRGGWHNPQAYFNRANLQLVGYRLTHNTLERLYWTHVDVNRQAAPKFSLPLFTEVKSFKVTVFHQGRWQNSWTDPNTLPTAVRIDIVFNQQISLQRVYKIRDE